jgi:hypothetical protein
MRIGEGVKMKTIEALAYGMRVIGYPEAFEGVAAEEMGGLCRIGSSESSLIERVTESMDEPPPSRVEFTLRKHCRSNFTAGLAAVLTNESASCFQ